MTVPFRLESRAEVQPVQGPRLHEYLLPDARVLESEVHAKLSTAELAFRIFAAFRAHPHINNVLTHVSRAKWVEVETSLGCILDLSTTSDGLSPLEENILELMVGERGISGKILKPYFVASLHRILGPSQAERPRQRFVPRVRMEVAAATLTRTRANGSFGGIRRWQRRLAVNA